MEILVEVKDDLQLCLPDSNLQVQTQLNLPMEDKLKNKYEELIIGIQNLNNKHTSIFLTS